MDLEVKLITFLIKFTYHFLWILIYRDLGKTCKTAGSCLDAKENITADSSGSCSTDVAWCRLSKIQGGRPSLVNFCWVYRPHLVVIECFDSHFHSYYRNEIKEQKLLLIEVTFQHFIPIKNMHANNFFFIPRNCILPSFIHAEWELVESKHVIRNSYK